MASRRVNSPSETKPRRRPAATPESRENQMIALAVDLAERQIRDGSASSQVISHYLKLGSSREKLEQERLAKENQLLEAKTEAMASAKRLEEIYGKALEAMKVYSGQTLLELEAESNDY